MSDAVRIAAETRTEFGKGAARRTRRAAKVPAVLYGHGEDPRHVALPGHELMIALKGGANTLLELQMDDGGTQLVLPRQVVRDPIKGFFLHLDLLVLRKGERVAAEVPVHLVGDAGPETVVDLQSTTLSIEADAISIPSAFEVSIEGLGAGSRITAAEVTLPDGVTLTQDPESVVVQILSPAISDADLEPADGEGLPVTDDDQAPGEGDIVPDTESGQGGPSEG